MRQDTTTYDCGRWGTPHAVHCPRRLRRNVLLWVLLLLSMTALSLPRPAWAGPYSQLFVFGDSLSDPGNAFLATGGMIPVSPPYFQGHFSNGPTYAEQLATFLGLQATPFLQGGTNFAIGSAKTGQTELQDMLNQVGLFLTSHPVADSRALYIVYGGANDLRALASQVAQGLAPLTDVVLPVQNLVLAISALAQAGARTFLVPTQSDLGRTPEALQSFPDISGLETQLSLLFNSALTTALDTLEAALPVDIRRLDTFALLHTVLATPSAFGFSNTHESCLSGSPTTGGIPCLDPDTYVFWDHIHPTAAGHSILADAALTAVIPEPTPGLLLATGLLVLLGSGWRQRRRVAQGGA